MKTIPPHPLSQRGFSTTEWVVGLAIVGMLLVIAFAYTLPEGRLASQSDGRRITSNARQIALACRLYAQANDGAFPTGSEPGSSSENANTVFQDLFTSGDMTMEVLFWHPRATHVCLPTPPNEDGILAAGENAFDYVSGLTDRSKGDLPLIVEAQTSPHRWDPQHGHPWDGQVMVGFVDASVSVLVTDRRAHDLTVPHASGGEVDLLSVEDEDQGVPGNLPHGTAIRRAAPVPSAP